MRRSIRLLLTSLVLSQAGALIVLAQPGRAPTPRTSGSVPTGTATSEVRRITLAEAVDMALQYNVGAVESGEDIRVARGQRLQALSALLPQANVGASFNAAQVTSASLGFNSPVSSAFVPPVIGPFHYNTVSASVSQIVVNVESIRRFRAAESAERASVLSYEDMLDLVTLATGNAYLQVLDLEARIEAIDAQVRRAKALYDQAVDAFTAGTTPRIDVTRTSVQLHTEQFNLTVARNNLAIAKLNLARTIGLPLGQPFEAADRLPYVDLGSPNLDEALQTAYGARADFRAAQQAVESAEHQAGAARARRYPALAVSGDYGGQGVELSGLRQIFGVQASISVPVFTGRSIEGEETQATAALRQRQAEREDLRGQIDYDVRTALLNLQAAREQVEVARESVALADESLARSQERFAAGVTDSVEVVQAQQALAGANDQFISGTYNHNVAKLQLARALGVARTGYRQYLSTR